MTAVNSAPLVAAYGHLFGDLDIEVGVLRRSGIELVDANPLDDDAIGRLGLQGILLGPFKKLARERLAGLPRCKAIVRYGIGVDNVDLQASKEAGIVVCNVPDYCVEEVAVHALACILALMRGLNYWDRTVRAGEWRGKHPPSLRRPSSCTLGIIGFGHIGSCLEDRARRVFGAIAVYDPWYRPRPHDARGEHTSFVADLDTLLRQSDVVSVHVPLTPDTQNMLAAAALRAMKPGAVVINASRGGIVNEQALLQAIREGRLAGAALDAFVNEPLPGTDALIAESRILLTPHVAWRSEEAEVELRRGAAEEMVRVLTGCAPRSPVDV